MHLYINGMVKKGKCYQISKRYYTKPVCAFHLKKKDKTKKTNKQRNKKPKTSGSNAYFRYIVYAFI